MRHEQGDAEIDVTGNNITLTAVLGAIGSRFNDLEIDTQHSAIGLLGATAAQSIQVSELRRAGTPQDRRSLRIDQVNAASSHVRITVEDTFEPGRLMPLCCFRSPPKTTFAWISESSTLVTRSSMLPSSSSIRSRGFTSFARRS